jgi:hypothetical protein
MPSAIVLSEWDSSGRLATLWWGDFMFTIEPSNLGTGSQADRPSMSLLKPYRAVGAGVSVPEPSTFFMPLAGLACGGQAMTRRRWAR